MKKLISGLMTGAILFTMTMVPALKCEVSAAETQTLFINEIMAANTCTIRDGDVDDPKSGEKGGPYSDWIELYNAGSQSIDLTGYTISDDSAAWTIPQGSIPAKGYLMIWASDKDKVAPDGQYHTNFKLTSAGETITLNKADGTVIDSVSFPALADDQSYCRVTDGAAEFALTTNSTPKKTNSTAIPTNTYKVCGYIKPDFQFSNTDLYSGFKVEINEVERKAETDFQGYFEMYNVPSGESEYTLKITKKGYLKREITIPAVKGDVTINSANSPIVIWVGDTEKDGAINMLDIVKVAECFNTVSGQDLYDKDADLNRDGAVNLLDIILIAAHFNKTAADYPAFK